MRTFSLAVASAATLSLALFVVTAAAQQEPAASPQAAAAPATDFSKVEIRTTDLGRHTYMLEGQGGNITAAVAANGVIVVDTQFAPLHARITAAIAAITKQPVRYVIDTHFHGDHVGGNARFAEEGAGIIGHENLRKRLAAGTVNGLTGAKTPPAADKALPGKTYGKATTLSLRGRKAELRHMPNAHTDGDTYVWFADANVLATGDIFSKGRYPNIDFANGGDIRGMIAGAEAFLKLARDETRIVPGHGPLATRADLAEYRDMLVAARERMLKLLAEGRSESEAVAARPFADYDAKLGADEQAAQNFIRVVYNSVKNERSRPAAKGRR